MSIKVGLMFNADLTMRFNFSNPLVKPSKSVLVKRSGSSTCRMNSRYIIQRYHVEEARILYHKQLHLLNKSVQIFFQEDRGLSPCWLAFYHLNLYRLLTSIYVQEHLEKRQIGLMN